MSPRSPSPAALPCSAVLRGIGMLFHLGNEALSSMSKPQVLNFLHGEITWETLNITDDLV